MVYVGRLQMVDYWLQIVLNSLDIVIRVTYVIYIEIFSRIQGNSSTTQYWTLYGLTEPI